MDKNWLKNSTYKPVASDEHYQEEDEIIDNELIGSSSDSYDNPSLHKLKTKKKNKHKKLKKRDIIKHYLNNFPSISDVNSPFRKYVFLENMPKEERGNNFFIDQKGNSQISRYGCIYEKHVPKYRSKQDNRSLKAKLSERYYEKLKSFKKDECRVIEKRLCDSHCICQQSFIPIPFDIDIQDKVILESKNIDDCFTNSPLTILNDTIKKDPHNIDAWLRLINHQSQSNSFDKTQSTDSTTTERKLMVAEKALSKNQSSIQLHLVRLQLGAELWVPDKLQKEWAQLIFSHSTNIDLWRFYIGHLSRQIISFSIDKVVNLYTKCFSIFFNIMSGRTRTKSIDSENVYELCDLFADYCDFLIQSGYSERATASWQALIEYNFFAPENSQAKSSGNLLDDPMLISFQKFWQSSRTIFGHPNAEGWAEFIKNYPTHSDDNSIQSAILQSVSDMESSLLNGDADEVEMWVQLEQTRQQAWWLPVDTCVDNNEQEDPDRTVPFQFIQPILITLHNPQNINGTNLTTDLSLKAKKRLLLLFLDHMGVSNARISIEHQLNISRIRWHQLEQICSVNKLIHPIKPQRQMSLQFIQCCLKQLRNVINDEDWNHVFSVLELSHAVQSNLSSCDSWKQALSSIKSNAKTILAEHSDNTMLWITYADLLVTMNYHDLFAKSNDKARSILINEVSKVVKPLVHQAVSISLPFHQKLQVLTLSLELISKKYSTEPFNQSILTEISSTLSPAAHIFAALHSLPPPINQTLTSFIKTFSDVVSAINGSCDSLISYWNQAVYFQIISNLIFLDLERFQDWMSDDCLLTISGIGSSCYWSSDYLNQLSQLLESSMTFIGWFYHSKGRNNGAILRSILTPFTNVLLQIQNNIKKPILEAVISPRLIVTCMGTSEMSEGQRLKLRNFLWALVGSFETETVTKFNINCQASATLLLSMEIDRLHRLNSTSNCESIGIFSGRIDRVRSTISRLINLRCMHWRYRLALWHSFMLLESNQIQSNRRDENTKGVFYRAITEMPSHKSLYVAIISLVPSMLDEVTLLMKNNRVRMCTPVEEVKLLIRIRQSNSSKDN